MTLLLDTTCPTLFFYVESTVTAWNCKKVIRKRGFLPFCLRILRAASFSIFFFCTMYLNAITRDLWRQFYATASCTLVKVFSYFDLSVLSMSVMGFQKKVWMGELYPSLFCIFWIFLTLQSPLDQVEYIVSWSCSGRNVIFHRETDKCANLIFICVSSLIAQGLLLWHPRLSWGTALSPTAFASNTKCSHAIETGMLLGTRLLRQKQAGYLVFVYLRWN